MAAPHKHPPALAGRREFLLAGIGALLLWAGVAMSRVTAAVAPGTVPSGVEVEFVANGSGRIEIGGSSDGRVTVIDFFADWCGACERTLPRLERVASASGARWISVGVGTSRDGVRRAAAAWGLKEPVAFDFSARAEAEYRVTALPTLVVLRPDGAVAFSHVGVLGSDELLRRIASAANADRRN